MNVASQASYAVGGTCSENTRTVTIGGDISGSATCTAGAWSQNFNLSAFADGNIAVTATHANIAGNSHTANATLVKNTVVPTVTLTTPIAINIANQAAYTLSGTCSVNGRAVVLGGAVSANPTCTSGTWSATVNYTAATHPVALTVDHQSTYDSVHCVWT